MEDCSNMNPKQKKNKSYVKINLILAFGFILVITGIFLLASLLVDSEVSLSVVRSLSITIIGGIILYFALIRSTGSWWLCIGLFLSLTGIFVLFLDMKIFHRTIEFLWPIIVIIAGISIFVAGTYKSKKIRLMFIVPAFLITVLGTIFLLFSLDIISEAFFIIAGRWWPAMFIFAGICLVVTFFLCNKTTPIIDTIDEEDEDDFSDIDTDGSRGL